MRFPSKEIVEGIRREYPAGTRVELVRMDDPQAPPVGTKGTVLGVDDIGAAAASDLTGAVIDQNGVIISASEDGGAPVAIGFRAKKANGKYRYFWLYKVKFGIPATNLTTKGESIEFSTPTIEGTVMRRNKVDGQGKHPWKAEVTEGDAGVSASTITNWYQEVYEPSYAAAAAASLDGEG